MGGDTSKIDLIYRFINDGHIKWLGTAGWWIRFGETEIAIDPFISRFDGAIPPTSRALDYLEHVDHFYIAHGHFDHIFDLPRLVEKSNGLLLGPNDILLLSSLKQMDRHQQRATVPLRTYTFRDYRVTAYQGKHIVVDPPLVIKTISKIPKGRLLGMFNRYFRGYPKLDIQAFLFDNESFTILDISSAAMPADSIKRLRKRVDLCLMPLQGHSNITKKAWEIASKIQPLMIIPHHWDNSFPPFSRFVDPLPFMQMIKEHSETRDIIVERLDMV